MTLSLLGTGWALFALVFPLIIYAPRTFYAVIISAPLAGLASRLVKYLADAPRPPAVLEPESFVLLGDALRANSMPSGHTITAFVVAAAIYGVSPPAYRRYTLALFVLAGAVGLSRIAIGVHWVEDVLVGAALGTVVGILGARIAKRLPDRLMAIDSPWLKGLSLWGLVCAGVLLAKKLDFAANKPAQVALAILAMGTFAVFWARSLKSKGSGIR